MGEAGVFNVLHWVPAFAAIAAALIAVALFRRNAPNYAALRAAVRPPSSDKPAAAHDEPHLAPDELHPHAKLRSSDPLLPELSLGWYGAAYLTRFIAVAQNRQVGEVSALAFYRRPTLSPNDMRFAAALGSALILGNLAIARVAPLQPYGGWLALVCAVMGSLYCACDIGENLILERIFSRGLPVDRRQAFRASALTRAKFTLLYLALPSLIGVAVKTAHDWPSISPLFANVLKFAPLVGLLAACLWPPLARVLWACRISVLSAVLGYFLFLAVVQAQDLFADTTYGSHHPLWHIGFWTFFFAALAFIWALPVHYAARDALEGDYKAPYTPHPSGPLVRWTPRALGLAPILAVLLGIFGAAVETRGATALDEGLSGQYVLLALGGWFTAGFVFFAMVDRRPLVARFLSRPGTANALYWFCAAATTVIFFWVFFFPLAATNHIARAALVPLLLGSGVLAFGLISRASDRYCRPFVGFVVAVALLLTAMNTSFNDVRTLSRQPDQISLAEAVKTWQTDNDCDGAKEKCPPVLIVAAEGGASRAAYFTAVVIGDLLDRLQKEKDRQHLCANETNPARCIFAMSGVSGGSLGFAAAKAALMDAAKARGSDHRLKPPCRAANDSPVPDGLDLATWKGCLAYLVSGDYLSAGFVGLAFRDQFAPPIPGFDDNERWGDRAVLLEKAWERDYLDKTTAGNPTCDSIEQPSGFCRPFAEKQDANSRWTPLLMLNGTSAQTGRRVIVSEFRPEWKDKDNNWRALHPWAYDLFEILGAPCDAEGGATCPSNAGDDWQSPTDVRLSTAALLSARFPFVSPAGTIRMRRKGATAPDSVFGDEVVDGGYFENSGLTTATELAAALHEQGSSRLCYRFRTIPFRQRPGTPMRNPDRKATSSRRRVECTSQSAGPRRTTFL